MRRLIVGLSAAALVCLVGRAEAQQTRFPTYVGQAPAFAPAQPAPPPGTLPIAPPPATFSGTIQPAAPGLDPYLDPSLQAPGTMGQQVTGTGPGYNFTRPDGSLGEWPRFLQQARLRYTWVYGQGDEPEDLEFNTAELDGTFVLPFLWNQKAPLLVTPGFAVHFVEGPQSSTGADLPPRLYDAYLDVGWRPYITERLSADLGFRTGVYSDFSFFDSESMRYMGRGYGVFECSPTLEIRAGIVYIDRLNIKLLPAGGIIWKPDPDTRWEILFPNPKLAQRLTTFGNVDLWWYVAGEYGGGTWTVEREPGGLHDQVEYDDLRVIGGLEWIGRLSLKGFVEAGYVFNRELRYRYGAGDMDPDNTFMIRGGIAF